MQTFLLISDHAGKAITPVLFTIEINSQDGKTISLEVILDR